MKKNILVTDEVGELLSEAGYDHGCIIYKDIVHYGNAQYTGNLNISKNLPVYKLIKRIPLPEVRDVYEWFLLKHRITLNKFQRTNPKYRFQKQMEEISKYCKKINNDLTN